MRKRYVSAFDLSPGFSDLCILSGIASLHIYLNAVLTCGISRRCWGTRVQRQQKYIRM